MPADPDDDDATPFGLAADPDADRPRPVPPPVVAPPVRPPPAPVTSPPWWVVPAGLLAFGLLLALGSAAVLGARGLRDVPLGMTLLVAVLVVLQVAFVTGLLTAVGQVFHIEYGPVEQALLKLAAVVAMVDGLTGAFLLLGSPCALMVAAVLGAGVFQYLFRLAIHETLVSVAAMVGAAFVLNGLAVAFVVRGAMSLGR